MTPETLTSYKKGLRRKSFFNPPSNLQKMSYNYFLVKVFFQIKVILCDFFYQKVRTTQPVLGVIFCTPYCL
jgi:hypothetical protein